MQNTFRGKMAHSKVDAARKKRDKELSEAKAKAESAALEAAAIKIQGCYRSRKAKKLVNARRAEVEAERVKREAEMKAASEANPDDGEWVEYVYPTLSNFTIQPVEFNNFHQFLSVQCSHFNQFNAIQPIQSAA